MLSLTRTIFTSVLRSSIECVIGGTQLDIMPFSTEQATDVVEIQQVVNLFAIAVEQHRNTLLPRIFTSDISFESNLPDRTILRGLLEVTQYVITGQKVPAVNMQSTNYVDLSNPRQPHATTYLTSTFFGSGGGFERSSVYMLWKVSCNYSVPSYLTPPTGVILLHLFQWELRYEDDFTKTHEGWRIYNRNLVISVGSFFRSKCDMSTDLEMGTTGNVHIISPERA